MNFCINQRNVYEKLLQTVLKQNKLVGKCSTSLFTVILYTKHPKAVNIKKNVMW